MAKRRALESKSASVEPAREGDIVRANVRREVFRSPSFVSLYANDTQVQTSPWDVRLIFGEIEDVAKDPPTVNIKQGGEVRMSPQHAKRVVMLLIQQLRNYEETIGPIPLPKEDD